MAAGIVIGVVIGANFALLIYSLIGYRRKSK